jgi:hypothetical protein
MMAKSKIFHVRFVEQQQLYDIYARQVLQSHLHGFIEVSDFVFSVSSELVIDPSEERLKSELSNVERLFVPLYAITRLEQVKQKGVVKIKPLNTKEQGNISRFPDMMMSPNHQGEK